MADESIAVEQSTQSAPTPPSAIEQRPMRDTVTRDAPPIETSPTIEAQFGAQFGAQSAESAPDADGTAPPSAEAEPAAPEKAEADAAQAAEHDRRQSLMAAARADKALRRREAELAQRSAQLEERARLAEEAVKDPLAWLQKNGIGLDTIIQRTLGQEPPKAAPTAEERVAQLEAAIAAKEAKEAAAREESARQQAQAMHVNALRQLHQKVLSLPEAEFPAIAAFAQDRDVNPTGKIAQIIDTIRDHGGTFYGSTRYHQPGTIITDEEAAKAVEQYIRDNLVARATRVSQPKPAAAPPQPARKAAPSATTAPASRTLTNREAATAASPTAPVGRRREAWDDDVGEMAAQYRAILAAKKGR